MATNEERREIAARLRNALLTEGSFEMIDTGNEERRKVAIELETVMDIWDLHYLGDVAERLADLIEPEERTCRMEYNERKRGVYCSNCGERMDMYTCDQYGDGTIGYSYPFCCECGARVTE